MKQTLQTAWLTRGWLACILWPLAQAYGLVVRLRRALYRHGFFRSERFKIPVVVVGNVIAGGAGKTPLVISLVNHLQAQQLKVGVVSRGYGRSSQDCLEAGPRTPVEETGDEPALIKRATSAPVFVANKRTEALRALLAAHPDTAVVICDDGLQHYALQRDIEIAAFDDRGTGNGWLLPAGPLREPWPERRRQGLDLVLHTGKQAAFEGYISSRRLADEACNSNGHRVALASLQGRPLVAMAGIANPGAFFGMLRDRGLTLETVLALPDHHDFSGRDLAGLQGRTVLCTEKDAVKLFALPEAALLELLAVPLVFSPEPAFFAAFDALLAPRLSAPSPLPSKHGHQIA
ncbi:MULTISPECIES: tetraacyldisaccharide 4'-kinase [unclassified Polaromonas]|uniref:tetraacyldisaccharide 4'-kinase n=1 Tax=unclassified Polaromonas TaxID=2638319 RepID=UPI000F094E03|nr:MULTISPECIES: tetraacyldisaccharide 4'-kinase [unclassified Polaromonas]AYQ29663.1 tetraacyldisaccharide 4'-kinase [Polaromonas sp. SP1]QGJ19224.1 tetraacyldisaccharide 4'-kinase [Polaromonas sp. Pch-P]